ncbi:MAG: sigma-70 family RNA polymerase sigma factor [Clostridia bacterium]|nr:sigma-70 family RNA polymerase sigma factor [Clostridia bacterium]
MEDLEELVIEAKNGNKESFSKLIVIIQKDLYKFAMLRLKNEDNVQDAIQNTILNAYLNIDQLRNTKYFKSWITRILINECNRIYRNSKKDEQLIEKYSTTTVEYTSKTLDFDSITEILDDSKKKIFELYYKEELTVKEISKKLNMSENTIKSELSRGRQKIRKSFKQASLIIIILCLLVTTSVIAISIISYIKSLFDVNSVGVKNDGVLMAIENLDWYQQIDMSYFDLGNGYKIKIEYILLDEMNLYIVFDFESEKDISKFNNISLSDLKITNENNKLICDKGNMNPEQLQLTIGDKLIEKDDNHLKSLIYMYTDSFPVSESLNISFSEITLYTKNTINTINSKVNFKIDLSEKFINRDYISYSSNESKIKKAIVTETGFYAIIETDNLETLKVKLLDENENIYPCYFNTLSSYNQSNSFQYIVIADFINTENKKLKLIISDKEIELIKDSN